MWKEISKKLITNFRLDYSLLSTNNLSPYEKIRFLLNKYSSIILNKREIKYLEKKFYYDNRFCPAMLEGYPKEISEINKTINLTNIKTILDIGANIGQFSYTITNLYPDIQLYSFEPNKKIYPLLVKNSANSKKWKIYNLGISKKAGTQEFYFSPSASAEGSLYQENMSQNYVRNDVEKIKIKTINLNAKKLKELKIPKKIDLVKIDVEGAEVEVLKSLKEIDFDYLFIEVSTQRKKGGSLEEITEILKKEKKVEPKLLHYNLPEKDSPCANAIFSLKPKKAPILHEPQPKQK